MVLTTEMLTYSKEHCVKFLKLTGPWLQELPASPYHKGMMNFGKSGDVSTTYVGHSQELMKKWVYTIGSTTCDCCTQPQTMQHLQQCMLLEAQVYPVLSTGLWETRDLDGRSRIIVNMAVTQVETQTFFCNEGDKGAKEDIEGGHHPRVQYPRQWKKEGQQINREICKRLT
ncbi:hypothetical protein Y1Q_0021654 [Alligator mississippiensis]|uniref:Uncharacterized protein n=1 Tax=Alligator mississippiensis TaxID=8496 RepID=A0A151PAD9_ALLMI|nr:hypothetical protein Y1Q_0021654 [Alligator mississippiensis]